MEQQRTQCSLQLQAQRLHQQAQEQVREPDGKGAGRYKPRENGRSRWLFLELKTCYVIIINSDIKQLIPNSY